MITVTIAEVAVKKGTNTKGDWVNTRIKDTEGNWYGSFNKQASELQMGQVVTFNPIVKGSNTNFEKWAMSDQPPKPVAQAGEISPQERGMFYKEIGEWLRSGKFDMSKPINQALHAKYWAQLLIAVDIKSESKEGE